MSRDIFAHANHARWQTWKITKRFAHRGYALGVLAGSGSSYSSECNGCVRLYWRGRRPYILGLSRNTWRCLLVGGPNGRHRPADQIGFGYCSKCLPCPTCGSETAGHLPGCADDWNAPQASRTSEVA